MDCAKANDLLLDFVEGALAEDVQREVQRHVDGCEKCMRELENLAGTTRTLQALGRTKVPPPPQLDSDIANTIKKTDATWYFARRYGIPAAIFAAVLAVALLAVVLILVLLK